MITYVHVDGTLRRGHHEERFNMRRIRIFDFATGEEIYPVIWADALNGSLMRYPQPGERPNALHNGEPAVLDKRCKIFIGETRED